MRLLSQNMELIHKVSRVTLLSLAKLGKTEDRRRSWKQRMRWLDSNINSKDMSLSKLWEMLKDREAWYATLHGGLKRIRYD